MTLLSRPMTVSAYSSASIAALNDVELAEEAGGRRNARQREQEERERQRRRRVAPTDAREVFVADRLARRGCRTG